MPQKRPGSPYWQIRRRSLTGYGDTGLLTTGVTSKTVARQMEQLLERMAERALLEPAWYALLDAVCKDKTVPLPDLLSANQRGRLDGLLRGLHDPSLQDAVKAFRATHPSREVGIGLDHLLLYAPKSARLSALDAPTITDICLRCQMDPETPRRRNSVRRTLLRAISLLVAFHLGKAERNRLFAEVQFAGEDDTREVHLTRDDIARLIGAALKQKPELALVVRVALQTSADRSVLLSGPSHHGKHRRGLLVRDLAIWEDAAGTGRDGHLRGEVYLHDTKTKSRTRTVRIGHSLSSALYHHCKAKRPDDPVFDMQYMELDYHWQVVRHEAGLDHVRFKDLRAQVSQYGEEAGIPLTVLSRTMGNQEQMTRRYQQRMAVMSFEHADELERAMMGKTAN